MGEQLQGAIEARIEMGALGRWVLVNAADAGLAWSGSRWVRHANGLPAAWVQISNFNTPLAAYMYALGRGLRPETCLVLGVGPHRCTRGILCLRCGMLSYSPDEIEQRSCPSCRFFDEQIVDASQPTEAQP